MTRGTGSADVAVTEQTVDGEDGTGLTGGVANQVRTRTTDRAVGGRSAGETVCYTGRADTGRRDVEGGHTGLAGGRRKTGRTGNLAGDTGTSREVVAG